MSSARLPAVRLSPVLSDGDGTARDTVLIDIPPSSKFGITWPSETERPTPPGSSPELETFHLDGVYTEEEHFPPYGETDQLNESDRPTSNPPRTQPLPNLMSTLPKFPRTLSMPLPSQLGRLQNPYRTRSSPTSREQQSDNIPAEFSQFRELSMELADSVQMAIQTMLQVSPPQVLDPAKEQCSACSIAVPTPSMSAMFTTMKSLNYISENMADFCADPAPQVASQELPGWKNSAFDDFDIGELLQSVGDALSGSAAQAGVDLVIYHGDVGMKHVMVKGDESGLSFALSHVVRQILNTARPGDSIELGLFIGPLTSKRQDGTSDAEVSGSEDDYQHGLPVEFDAPLECTIEVAHKFGSSEFTQDSNGTTSQGQIREQPSLSSLLLNRLLRRIGAHLVADLSPEWFLGRSCELKIALKRGRALANTPSTAIPDIDDDRMSHEPSLAQLTTFAECLRGKKASLYASSKGSFAHHFTSYLTAWGMDVSHISGETEGEDIHVADTDPTADPRVHSPSLSSTYNATANGITSGSGTPKADTKPHSHPVSFIFIDDDVAVLKERLQALRVEQPYPLTLNIRKRPPLLHHHRPRSSNQVNRMTSSSIMPASSSVVIVHFTSLSNYKVIRDMIQSILGSYADTTSPIPEVMIIPKPAGPRRFLTALHTAVTKPLVDPFFTPIATSPITPVLNLRDSLFPGVSNTRSLIQNRLSGSRTNSDRSARSSKDIIEHAGHAPPSPLGMTDSMEYFSEAAAKLGASPSSGLVIQSPDGQPAGIFFHPRARTPRFPSIGTPMERDKGQLSIPQDGTVSTPRRTSDCGPADSQTVTFSSLHEIVASRDVSRAPSDSLMPRARKKLTSPRTEEHGAQPPPHASIRRASVSDAILDTTTPPSSPQAEGKPLSPRRGSTRRPAQDTKAANVPTPSTKKGKLSENNIVPPISVLIVDDNPINQTILSTFMKKKKIKYDVANNGQEAVEKWRNGGFHLILMDIQMPVMDGIQATKEIRRLEKANAEYPPTPNEDRPTPVHTPSDLSSEPRSSPHRSSVIIVALTASSLQSDRVAALAAGCNDFLTKPVGLTWLNSKIIEWGSIKALQMWADLRPDAVKSISSGQAAQARSVADRLHVPRDRTSSSPGRPPSATEASPVTSESPAPIAEAVSASSPSISTIPLATTASGLLISGAPPPATFWGSGNVPPPSAESLLNTAQSSPSKLAKFVAMSRRASTASTEDTNRRSTTDKSVETSPSDEDRANLTPTPELSNCDSDKDKLPDGNRPSTQAVPGRPEEQSDPTSSKISAISPPQ